MNKRRNARHWDSPQLHGDHPRPVTRRQFVAQGLLAGSAYTTGGLLGLLAGTRRAEGALSGDLANLLLDPCQIATDGAQKIPFICFDLAGGANIAGSNVLVGKQGGQNDFLSTAGYSKMGLPGDMVPGLNDPVSGEPYANFDLGLGFHSDRGKLRLRLCGPWPGGCSRTATHDEGVRQDRGRFGRPSGALRQP